MSKKFTHLNKSASSRRHYIVEVVFIKLTAAISFPGIKFKAAKTKEAAPAAIVFSGDADALAVIYDQHAAALYRLLLAVLGNSEDAEDALQEIFVKLATKPLSHVQDLRPYLFKMARNSAINILRRRQRENCLTENCIEENIQTNADKFDPANQDWQKMLARLPLQQREIIALKIWEEMTFAEIAAVVKASPNTVASRYRYGIERLRKWYEEEEADEQ